MKIVQFTVSLCVAIALCGFSAPQGEWGNIHPSTKERFDTLKKEAKETLDLVKYLQPSLSGARQSDPNAVFSLINMRGSRSSGRGRGISFQYGARTALVDGFEIRFDFLSGEKVLGSEYYYGDRKTILARPARDIVRYFATTPEAKDFKALGVSILLRERSGRVVELTTTYTCPAWSG